MSHYRRACCPGVHYFFTLVTYDRQPLFLDEAACACLRHAWREVRERRPFELVALCLLPEHLHCVWRLPEGDSDFSKRWAAIKAIFTREYLRAGGREAGRGRSQRCRQEAAVWQRRFWEHQVRDEVDLNRHINYVHFNAVKHGLVSDPADWPWSTYHRYLREGYYGGGWPAGERGDFGDMEAGE